MATGLPCSLSPASGLYSMASIESLQTTDNFSKGVNKASEDVVAQVPIMVTTNRSVLSVNLLE